MTEPTPATVAQDAIDKLSRAIETITDKTGEVAPHAWEIMVQRQVTEGWATLVAVLVFDVVTILLCRWAWRFTHKERRGEAAEILLTSFCGGLAVMAIIITIAAPTDAVFRLLNPEYYAAIELLEAIR